MMLFAGWGQQQLYGQEALDNDPGYVDFSSMEDRVDATPDFQINIKGQLIKLVAEA